MKKILSSSKAHNFPEKFIYLQQIVSHEMLQRLHVKLAILTVLALRFRWGFSSMHVHKNLYLVKQAMNKPWKFSRATSDALLIFILHCQYTTRINSTKLLTKTQRLRL